MLSGLVRSKCSEWHERQMTRPIIQQMTCALTPVCNIIALRGVQGLPFLAQVSDVSSTTTDRQSSAFSYSQASNVLSSTAADYRPPIATYAQVSSVSPSPPTMTTTIDRRSSALQVARISSASSSINSNRQSPTSPIAHPPPPKMLTQMQDASKPRKLNISGSLSSSHAPLTRLVHILLLFSMDA